MYYNRRNLELILEVKRIAERHELVFAQTSSRLNGSYLDACRVYGQQADKGHPDRAIWVGRTAKDFREYLQQEDS